MTTEKKTSSLRNELEKNLMTLKRNREHVSLELLKTRYATGYATLCNSIKQAASAYLKETVLCGIRIREDYAAEGIALIQKCIDDSGLLNQLSKAAFYNQNIAEFDALADKLHEKILMELEDFYYRHLGLYLSFRCLENPYPPPKIYCPINGCILLKGGWIPLEEFTKNEETENPGKPTAGQSIKA